MSVIRLLVILLLSLAATHAQAQSAKAYERAGDKSFEQTDYFAASKYYSIVLEKDPKNHDVRYKYAESARLFQAFAEAEKSYRMILDANAASKETSLLRYRLAEVLKLQGDYAGAVASYEQFLKEQPTPVPSILDNTKQQIQYCQWAMKQMARGEVAKVTQPGKQINSEYSDFGAMVNGDKLYYSSYRFDRKKDSQAAKRKRTHIMQSIGGARSKEWRKPIEPSDTTAHIAHLQTNPDEKFLFFTACSDVSPTQIRCTLYVKIKGSKGKYSKPILLPSPINIPGSTTTQPYVVSDSEGRPATLYFASDREGGKGKLDIYSVALDTAWFCPCKNFVVDKIVLPPFGNAENLSDINTEGNDATPFYHAPSRTLYFSNDSRLGFGGYDIYTAEQLSNIGFAAPKNVGYGLNSSYNDLYPLLADDGKTGWITSNRLGAYFLDPKNKACCNDLFKYEMNPPLPPEEPEVITQVEETPPQPPIVEKKEESSPNIPPLVTKVNPTPPRTEIITPPVVSTEVPIAPTAVPSKPTSLPTDVPIMRLKIKRLQDFTGLPLYFDNDEPDKRTTATTTKQNYEQAATAYLAREDEYLFAYSNTRKDSDAKSAQDSIRQFFTREVRGGYNKLFELTDALLVRLKAGDKVTITIKGFTSPRAKSDYNEKLGKRRISSVRNHFSTWQDAELLAYIQSGRLVIQESNFGETTAAKHISDDLADELNSIYSPSASRERRVEIIEIREEKK